RAEEALAGRDRIEQCLFPFLGHRRRTVRGLLGGQVAGGIEKERVILRNFLWDKNATVLCRRDFEAMLHAEFGDNLLGVGQLAGLTEAPFPFLILLAYLIPVDDRMLKSLAAREHEDSLLLPLLGGRPAKWKCAQAGGERKGPGCL